MIEPKVDWLPDDSFNFVDYNRIQDNMIELIELTERYFGTNDWVHMNQKTSYSDVLYAEEFNALERNLRLINESTVNADIGEEKVYASNDRTPDYKEFNRIEQAQLLLFERIMIHVKNSQHLAYELGQTPISYREV